MSRVFNGKVSIVLNTKGEIALKRDSEGRFSAENATEIYETMLKLAKARKATINKYSLFRTESGKIPVLLANRYGNPYIALLPEKAENGVSVPKKTVTKLA